MFELFSKSLVAICSKTLFYLSISSYFLSSFLVDCSYRLFWARFVKILTGDYKARENLVSLVSSLREKCWRCLGIEVCYVSVRR